MNSNYIAPITGETAPAETGINRQIHIVDRAIGVNQTDFEILAVFWEHSTSLFPSTDFDVLTEPVMAAQFVKAGRRAVVLAPHASVSGADFLDFLVRDDCRNLKLKLAYLPQADNPSIVNSSSYIAPELLKSHRERAAE